MFHRYICVVRMRDTVERSETRRHPQGGPGQTGRSLSRETTGEPRRSESIEVRTLAEHSDLIRIRMDRRLKDRVSRSASDTD